MSLKTLSRSHSEKHFFSLSVGKLLAILMAAYFIFILFSVSDSKEINYYEVEEGSLVKEHLYKGLIIRNEEVYTSDMSGTVYYFASDGRKLAKGKRVYSIDSQGNVAAYLKKLGADSLYTVDEQAASGLRKEISDFVKTFELDNFSALYDIKSSLYQSVFELNGLSIFSRSADEMAEEGINFSTYYTDKTGTVCLYTDGYEGISYEDIDKDIISGSLYNKSSFLSGDLIEAGTPVYKLITDENWKIVFELSDEDRDFIEDGVSYRLSFPDKGFSAVAKLSTFRGADSALYGVIDMNSYAVQFTGDRFINFEIVTNNVSGLKVPDKALTSKDFYVIPLSYLAYDDAGNSGFLKVGVGESAYTYDFIICDIYSIDDEYCYIECDDTSLLKPGDFVALSVGDADHLYEIAKTLPLTGAYNINKGYAVFRKAEVLESSNGYSIIKKGTDYGLSAYDHIILDASGVVDGELLIR